MTKCKKWMRREEHLPYPQPWEFVRDQLIKSGPLMGGTFVEIGACDGVDSSNCHFFESEWDWNGFCVEPNPHTFNLLKDNRKNTYNCAITEEGVGTMDFCSILGEVHCLSGLVDFFSESHKKRIDKEIIQRGGAKEVIAVSVRSLKSLLRENKIHEVHYLSVDCEGADLSVLKSVDYTECNIHIISVEHNEYDKHNSTAEFLGQKGYQMVAKICADSIFVKKQ